MQNEEQSDSSNQLNTRRKRRWRGLYFITKRAREQANIMKKKSQKIVYQNIIDLAETIRNINIFEMKENNEEYEVDLDADAIQHIAGQFQNKSDNNTSLQRKQNQHQ